MSKALIVTGGVVVLIGLLIARVVVPKLVCEVSDASSFA
jgi:hypothetical protein